jgi:hypothetical protein
MNRLRMEGRASIDAAEAEVKRIDRELDTLLNLILKGGAADRLEKMVVLERRQKELKAFLEDAEEPPPSCIPTWRIITTSKSTNCMPRFRKIRRRSGWSPPT